MNGNGRFHTAYYSKEYNDNGVNIANLDLDDVTSYGPETTTVNKVNEEGMYSFYVHQYSSDGALSTSNAKVNVYSGSTLVSSFNVPQGKTGRVWHVFDYDAVTDQIIPINEFSNYIVRTRKSNDADNNGDITKLIELVETVKKDTNLIEDEELLKLVEFAEELIANNYFSQEEIDELIRSIE